MFLRVVGLCALAFVLITTAAFGEKPFERPPLVTEEAPTVSCNMQSSGELCMPLDSTWQVVTFGGAGNYCSGPAAASDPCQRNDDDFTFEVPLNFSFNLYGTLHNSVFINNNGNLSFGAGYCTYTPSGFPVSGFPMVAAYWGDVDTRASSNNAGVTWYKQGPNYLAVTWDHVGYYSWHYNKQNTFQLIISDGTYEPIGIDNNFCFCYGNMDWTTGDASGGIDGLGGTGATAGVNKGDGVWYFQIGRFNRSGTDYDGPGGNYDGVDWLDGKRFCGSVIPFTNQNPLPINFPVGDTVSVFVGDTLELSVGFTGPENGQTVHTDVNDGGLANFVFSSTDGNPSVIQMTFIPDVSQLGSHVIHFTATDDFNSPPPPGVTEKDLTIRVLALVPECEVSPESLDFGTVTVGQSSDKSFTITNVGDGALSGAIDESCPDYSLIYGSGSYSLGAAESVTVIVRFSPTSPGTKVCTIQTGANCNNVSCTGIGEAQPVGEMYFDIKPGSCPSPINPKENGVIPAAVFGASNFDVMAVQPSTVRLTREGMAGEVAPLRWAYEDVGTPSTGEPCECHAAGSDGYIDLTLKFSAQEVIQTLGLNAVAGQTVTLILTATLADNTTVNAQDCVRILLTGSGRSNQGAAGGFGFVSGDLIKGAGESKIDISFSIVNADHIRIDIFNVEGRMVRSLLDKQLDPGTYSVAWDAKDVFGQEVHAGIYFVKLSSTVQSATKKIAIIR